MIKLLEKNIESYPTGKLVFFKLLLNMTSEQKMKLHLRKETNIPT
jgi:hypothetical protein